MWARPNSRSDDTPHCSRTRCACARSCAPFDAVLVTAHLHTTATFGRGGAPPHCTAQQMGGIVGFVSVRKWSGWVGGWDEASCGTETKW